MKKSGLFMVLPLYILLKNLEVKSALLLPLPSPPLPNILLGSLELTNTPPPSLGWEEEHCGLRVHLKNTIK